MEGLPKIPTGKRRRNQTSSEESYAGPANPVTPYTPRADRIRRRQGSAEDKPMNTHSEIIMTQFRVGGPRLCRLPVVRDIISSDHPAQQAWRLHLEVEVEEVLEKWNIKCEVLALRRRRWLHDPISSADHTETIMIGVIGNERDSDWYHACVDILQLCVSHHMANLNVEIANLQGLLSTQFYWVEQQHPIIHVWHALEPQILRIIAWSDWVALDVLRRGTNQLSENNPVTM